MKYHTNKLVSSINLTFVTLLFISCSVIFAKEARQLEWGDLAPEGYFESLEKEQKSMLGGIFDELGFAAEEEQDESEEAQNAYAEMQTNLRSAPIVKELNGEYVKIPGYIVPLEFDFKAGTFSEFLLAPYFGACIHVPPDAVWVTGTLTTDSVDSEYGFAGYSMNEIDLEIYDGE